MKQSLLVLSALALSAVAAPSFAVEGRVIACYDKVWVPAKYETNTSKSLHTAARTVWEHRGDQFVEVYYPPVYIESSSKKLVKPGHYVKRPAECKSH